MLSNTWDANSICRLSGYTKHILVIRMVRETKCSSLKVGRYEVAKRRSGVEHPKIYKVLQRGYIS